MFTTYLITVQTIHHLKLKTIYFILDRCPYRYENYLIWRKHGINSKSRRVSMIEK